MHVYLQVVILAIVQGITEFLPVSSSAHLVILPKLAGWQELGLSFDIALHLGSLIAVLSYFKVEIKGMLLDGCKYLTGVGAVTSNVALIFQLILGTLPLVILTLFARNIIEIYLHSIPVIAISTIMFAGVLYLAEWYGKTTKAIETKITYKNAFLIGLAQMLTVIPGVSRSGITLSAGLALGFNRIEAAKFSFLLSIPAILGAGVFSAYNMLADNTALDLPALVLGFFVSAVVSYFSIHYFLKLLRIIGVLPFVVYRLVLGLYLLFMWI